MKRIIVLLITVLVAFSVIVPAAAQSQTEGAAKVDKVHLGEVIKPKLEEVKSLHNQAADLREDLKASRITFKELDKTVRELLKPYRDEISAVRDSQLSLAGEMVDLRIELKAARDTKDADKAAASLDAMIQVMKQRIDNLEKLLEIRGEM